MNETGDDKYNLKIILERNKVFTEDLLLELEKQVDLILKVDNMCSQLGE